MAEVLYLDLEDRKRVNLMKRKRKKKSYSLHKEPIGCIMVVFWTLLV